VFKLGELFVKELNLEPGTDTFSKWMAFYLAQKMQKINTSEGLEKENAEKECFEIILKLWEHRWRLPRGRRPLENFEPIFNLLQNLNPDNKTPYFFSLPDNHRDRDESSITPDVDSLEFWIAVAEQIDKSARILLQAVLQLAAEKASNIKNIEWLKATVTLPESVDTQIIRIIVDGDDDIIDDDGTITDPDFEKKYKIEQLKSYIDHLDRVNKLGEFIMQKFQEDVSKMQ